MARTKGEWRRNISPIHRYPVIYAGEAPRHTFVAKIICDNVSPEEAEDNADFMIRAVNAHDDLVEALKSLIEFTEQYAIGKGVSPEVAKSGPIMARAHAALAKAGA